MYAVQPCGYATLCLHMQNAGFLMTRLILWKPKINNTQAIKMIIFRGEILIDESPQYVSKKKNKKNAQMHAL